MIYGYIIKIMSEIGKDKIGRPTPYGKFLTGLRHKADLTLRQMAEQSGIKHSTLSQLELGKRIPPSRPDTTDRFYDQLRRIPGITGEDVETLIFLSRTSGDTRNATAAVQTDFRNIFFPSDGIMITIHPGITNFSDEEIRLFRQEVVFITRSILQRKKGSSI